MYVAGPTGMAPAPTKLTIIDVVVLELCRRTVTNIPTIKLATGFVFPPKSPPAAHPVSTLAPVPRSSKLNMNQ